MTQYRHLTDREFLSLLESRDSYKSPLLSSAIDRLRDFIDQEERIEGSLKSLASLLQLEDGSAHGLVESVLNGEDITEEDLGAYVKPSPDKCPICEAEMK